MLTGLALLRHPAVLLVDAPMVEKFSGVYAELAEKFGLNHKITC